MTDLHSRVALHSLTMVPDGDDVMVGRSDIGSYAVFPPEGAEMLRQLDAGDTVGEVAAWYERTHGSPLDVEDYLAILEDLQFIAVDEIATATQLGPVRWQRLGRAVFSPPAWAFYVLLVGLACAVMARDPALRPSYRNIFFTHYISLIPVAIMAAAIPCILVHESFHALAGRRLGLPSHLRFGRRLVYLVAETRIDALYSVPRRARYLPFLAGMVADVVIVSALTLLAGLLRQISAPPWIPGFMLGVAFTGILRLLWQFLFYVETDLYFVGTTLLGCANLQNATRHLIASRVPWVFRRHRGEGAQAFSPHEQRVARIYAPMLVTGYAVSIATFVWAGLPVTAQIWSIAFGRLSHRSSWASTVDTLAFLLIEAAPLVLVSSLALRDLLARRRHSATN